jgi:SAM-dependent methyltransferase
MAAGLAVNHWPAAKTAKAFWGQCELPPYKQLLNDTMDRAAPTAGERWLDLGCGGGSVTKALWKRTNGRIGEVVALDCAAVNADAYERLKTDLTPPPGDRIRFACHDFSHGLNLFPAGRFDGVVSGLSISYAESFDPATGKWTTEAYDALLGHVAKVLRPGGRFVFSVNVPEPSWGTVAFFSLPALFLGERPLRAIKRSWRMMKYGAWLKREARTGRFHYLPADDITRRLAAAGFVNIDHILSYRRQAFVFRAVKPL